MKVNTCGYFGYAASAEAVLEQRRRLQWSGDSVSQRPFSGAISFPISEVKVHLSTAIRRSACVLIGDMKLCCAQRHHIIACGSWGKSQGETFRLLQEVYGDDSLSRSTCRRWYIRAVQGDKSAVDKPRPGRQPTAHNLANVRAVSEVLQEDRRATVCQVAVEVNLSQGSVHSILRHDLQMKKKAPKFVPRVLTQEQKDFRVSICRENSKSCEDLLFLWSVVTGDESWFSVLEPEHKQQSCKWMGPNEKRPKKALRSRQAHKTMMEVFFDDQGIVHLEFLPPKMTVTSKVYIGILGCLHETIQRKRPQLWMNNSYQLLHDNAPAHKSVKTFAAMTETSMTVVRHPPYSPDLALADFWLFPYLKGHIRGRIFGSVAELQDALMVIISQIPCQLFHQCIHVTLPHRWRKCITAHGEYFEGDDITLPRDSQLLESSSESSSESEMDTE